VIKKLAPAAALIAASLLTACSGGDGGGDGGDEASKRVFFLLPNSTTTRFELRDAPLFEDYMKELSPDTEVVVLNAEGDPDKQQDQVNDAVTQGAAAIVLVSADANLAAGALEVADQGGVPVVLYEHDAIGGPADAQVLFDARQVGEEQGKRAAELINAMEGDGLRVARVKGNPGEYGTNQYQAGQDEHLQPLIDSGKIQVACEENITNWDPVEGQAFAEDCLTKENNDIDLFITMNDGLAGGIVAALESQGLAGKIPVTGGQNGDLNAMQFIVQGKLDNTIFKDLSTQAKAAAEVTASIVAGDGVPQDMVNGEMDNEFAEIPAVFLPVENMTIDNVQDAVDQGVWTWEEICEGAEDVPICKENLA
jgi:D-xylose transport system substrate-binding protein